MKTEYQNAHKIGQTQALVLREKNHRPQTMFRKFVLLAKQGKAFKLAGRSSSLVQTFCLVRLSWHRHEKLLQYRMKEDLKRVESVCASRTGAQG